MGAKYSRSDTKVDDAEPSRKRKREDEDKNNGPSTSDILNTPKRKRIKSTSKYIYQTLFLDSEDSDVTIRALNKDWKLHRLYLKQSPYFASMFSGPWKESSMEKIEIEILDDNITEESLKIAFGSLYKDDIFIKPVQIVGVLASATLLQLDSLIQHCSIIMTDTLSAATVCVYHAASSSYGLETIREKCMNWLTKNILVVQDVTFMAEISIDLMKEIVSSPHLFVMQVEIDTYTMLKKWVYLLHKPEWSGESKELVKVMEAYFKEKLEGTNRCFLELEDGQKFIPVFSEIRWHHVINDIASIKVIETDKVMPIAWLEPVFLYGWRRVLNIEQGHDKGPEDDVSDEVFNEACSRCGRILQKPGEYCWRWVGYSYGMDLLISLSNRNEHYDVKPGGVLQSHVIEPVSSKLLKLLTLKRNTYTQTCPQAVSLQAQRHLCYRLTVSSLDADGKEKATKTTGVKKISLGKDEDEFAMVLDKTLEHPLAISLNVMMLSPVPELPIPRLKIPDTPRQQMRDRPVPRLLVPNLTIPST